MTADAAVGRGAAVAAGRWALIAALALEAAYLVRAAWRLPIDYFDGGQFLINALAFAGRPISGAAVRYYELRPPLTPLLFSLPLRLGLSPQHAAIHLTALALSVLAVAAVYRLLRLSFDGPAALLGAAFVAFNPLFGHYAPFVMSDAIALALISLAMAAWLRSIATNRTRHLFYAGLWLCLAMFTRYIALVAPALFVLHEALRQLFDRRRREAGRLRAAARATLGGGRLWIAAVGGTAVFAAGSALLGVWAAGGAAQAWDLARDMLSQQNGLTLQARPTDPASEFVTTLLGTWGWPLCLMLCLGCVEALRRRRAADSLCLIFFLGLGLLHSLVIKHNEARYVFVLLPAAAHLALLGGQLGLRLILSALRGLGVRPIGPGMPAVIGALLLLIVPVTQSVKHLARFEDPVYSRPFVSRVAEALRAHLPDDAPIYWYGGFYSVYPLENDFLATEEFIYFHHVIDFSLELLLGRDVRVLRLDSPIDSPQLLRLFDRDGALVAPTGPLITAENVAQQGEPPSSLRVLFVQRAGCETTPVAGDVALKCRSQRPDAPVLELAPVESGWRLKRPVPDGWAAFAIGPDGARSLNATEPLAFRPRRIELLRVGLEEFRFR